MVRVYRRSYIPEDSKYPFKELPFYEIGWRLIPEVWGNGLATEGAAVLSYTKKKALLNYIVLHLKQIYLQEGNGENRNDLPR